MEITIKTLNNIQENIQYDSILLDECEKNQKRSVLRIWESEKYVIVLGRSNKEEKETYIKRCKEDHIPIIKRASIN